MFETTIKIRHGGSFEVASAEAQAALKALAEAGFEAYQRATVPAHPQDAGPFSYAISDIR